MFKIDANTNQIHITRGDIACISVKVKNEDGTDYQFKTGDVVRFTVFKSRDCACVELNKDTTVETPTTNVDIYLTTEDTKIGRIINRPKDYWYEVVLNPDTNPQTIIGYDLNKEKKFTLYPEASDEK